MFMIMHQTPQVGRLSKIALQKGEMVINLLESAYECTNLGEEFSCSPCPVGYMGRSVSPYENIVDALSTPVCLRCPAGMHVCMVGHASMFICSKGNSLSYRITTVSCFF